jgi:hypothetical protein
VPNGPRRRAGREGRGARIWVCAGDARGLFTAYASDRLGWCVKNAHHTLIQQCSVQDGSAVVTTYSDEEATQERVEQLGEEKGVFFRNLEKQLYTVRILWKTYVGLFGTNKERVDLLNSVSSATSYQIERAMRESALLSICRMTDPKKGLSGTQDKNITVRRLDDCLANGSDLNLTNLVNIAIQKAEFARLYRNKKLAHSDDDTMNGRLSVISGSRNDMVEAMDAIAACIKRFATLELNTTLITHPISQVAQDEVEFLQVLHYGKIELDRRRVESCKILSSGDLNASRELTKLPEWLTFRPPQLLDV